MTRVKTPTRPTSAKNVTGDFGQFTEFMKQLVSVPHDKIKAALDAEKKAKREKRGPVSSGKS